MTTCHLPSHATLPVPGLHGQPEFHESSWRRHVQLRTFAPRLRVAGLLEMAPDCRGDAVLEYDQSTSPPQQHPRKGRGW